MPSSSNTYYTLLASLPALPKEFRQAHVPISRPRLEDRLAMLEEEIRDLVALLFALLDFDNSEEAQCDAKQRTIYRKLYEAMAEPKLRELVDVPVDARDIVAAFRARRQQRDPPPMLGKFADHIKRNWQHPDFRLGLRFPWIGNFRLHLDKDKMMEAEDIRSRAIWLALRSLGEQHHFSLAALIAYLLQWHLISGWSARDVKAGRQRFSDLLTRTMEGYGTPSIQPGGTVS